MKLARFIQSNMGQLLEEWEKAVLEIAPELKGLGTAALRDHARSMLGFISQDIGTSQTRGESARKALGNGQDPVSDTGAQHGIHRLEQGLTMLQVVQELRALRARVTRAWSVEQRGLTEKDIDELVRFNEAIDQLIAASVASFSARKDQVIRLIETMLKASAEPAAIFDPNGKYLFLNKAMADLLDAKPRDAIGKTPLELGTDRAEAVHEAITRSIATGQAQHIEHHRRSPSGYELFLDCQLVPVYNNRKEIEAVVMTSRDITERKKSEQEVWRSANFDSLTGIANRRLFIDRLEQTLLEASRNGSSFALLFIDLDLFKQANDQLGHEGGDRLLIQVAERISNSVRAVDTLARLGGDEFILILKETDQDGAKEAARALLISLERVFEVDAHQVHISGSIGLTVFPTDGTSVNTLIHNADQAMYAAKELGGQQVQVYKPSMAATVSDHMRLTRELEEAISDSQLEVYYQPIINIRTGAISRAEALLRWNHPTKGVLTPSHFLSISEYIGMTDAITAFVLEQAVRCSLQWRDPDDGAFPININESPASFVTRSLVDEWRAWLNDIGLEDSQITMELAPESVKKISASGFNPVKSLGLAGLRLHLAIDDFGIESFSLSALHEFRMESVKVDRDLIKDAGQGGDADDVLKAIIAMAHSLNVQVIAVGVEEIEQLHFLTRVGCDYAQGFLFSEPLRRDDFDTLLRRDRQK